MPFRIYPGEVHIRAVVARTKRGKEANRVRDHHGHDGPRLKMGVVATGQDSDGGHLAQEYDGVYQWLVASRSRSASQPRS